MIYFNFLHNFFRLGFLKSFIKFEQKKDNFVFDQSVNTLVLPTLAQEGDYYIIVNNNKQG